MVFTFYCIQFWLCANLAGENIFSRHQNHILLITEMHSALILHQNATEHSTENGERKRTETAHTIALRVLTIIYKCVNKNATKNNFGKYFHI